MSDGKASDSRLALSIRTALDNTGEDSLVQAVMSLAREIPNPPAAPDILLPSVDEYARTEITDVAIQDLMASMNVLDVERHLNDVVSLRGQAESYRQMANACAAQLLSEFIADALQAENSEAKLSLANLASAAYAKQAQVDNGNASKNLISIQNAEKAAISFRQALRRDKRLSFNLKREYESARDRYVDSLKALVAKAHAIRLTMDSSFGKKLPNPWPASEPDPIHAVSKFITEAQAKLEECAASEQVHTLYGLARRINGSGDTLIAEADFQILSAALRSSASANEHSINFSISPILQRYPELQSRLQSGESKLRLLGITASPILQASEGWAASFSNRLAWSASIRDWGNAVSASSIRIAVSTPQCSITLSDPTAEDTVNTVQLPSRVLRLDSQRAVLPDFSEYRIDNISFPDGPAVINRPMSLNEMSANGWKIIFPTFGVNSVRKIGGCFADLLTLKGLVDTEKVERNHPHGVPAGQEQQVEFANIAIAIVVAEVVL